MKHRFLYIMALLLTLATGAWAQDPDPIDLTPSADGTVWTLSTMPEYDVELEVTYYTDEEVAEMEEAAYTAGVDLTPSADGKTWTLAATPAFDIELEVEYETDLALNEEDDNTDALDEWDGYEADVTLAGRTLYKDGYWNTLTLPFALGNAMADEGHHFDGTLLEGATVKELDGSTSNLNSEGLLTLNFSDALSIEAGKPYIIKWASGDNLVNPVFTGVTVSNAKNDVAFTGGSFKGNYKPLEITDANRNDIVVLAVDTNGNKLGYVNTNRTLYAFHAYFYIPGSTQAREFVLNTDNESTQTGIGHTEITEITEKADAIYDLQGRRVENPKKGLYIVNGKKVVIK